MMTYWCTEPDAPVQLGAARSSSEPDRRVMRCGNGECQHLHTGNAAEKKSLRRSDDHHDDVHVPGHQVEDLERLFTHSVNIHSDCHQELPAACRPHMSSSLIAVT